MAVVKCEAPGVECNFFTEFHSCPRTLVVKERGRMLFNIFSMYFIKNTVIKRKLFIWIINDLLQIVYSVVGQFPSLTRLLAREVSFDFSFLCHKCEQFAFKKPKNKINNLSKMSRIFSFVYFPVRRKLCLTLKSILILFCVLPVSKQN